MLRSFLTIGALQFLTMLVLLVRTKALALLLGPENVGAMAVTDKLLAVIVQTVSLSFPFAALRFLPTAWAEGPDRYAALLRRMLGILLAAIVLATAGSVLITLFAPGAWGRDLLPYRSAVLWAALSIPVLGLVPFVQNAIAGRMREAGAMRFTLAHAFVFAASAAIGAWWKGLVGVYILYSVLGLVVVGWGLRQAFRGTAGDPAAARHDEPGRAPITPSATQEEPLAGGSRQRGWLGLPTPVWRFSTALMILAFVTPFVALRVHYAVLSELGAQTAGWMQAAIGLSLSVRALLGSAHPVFLTPNVNRGGAPVDRLAWANVFQRTFCLLTVALVPPLLLFSGLAVRVLYSPAFAPGAAFAAYFVLAEVINLISGTYQALILAFDHMVFHVLQNVTAQLIMVGTALMLIPRLGIAGAGIGALTAPVFLYGTTLLFLRHRHGLHLPAGVSRLGAFTIVALATAGIVGAAWPSFGPAAFAGKLAVYGAIVAGGSLFLLADERQRLIAFLPFRRRAADAAA